MKVGNNRPQPASRHAYRSARTAARHLDHPCSSRQLCPRCALMRVIQYRFNAFQRAFGRIPGPDEPLFFAANCSPPQRAPSDQVMSQLRQAAIAAGVPLAPLMKFLGFE